MRNGVDRSGLAVSAVLLAVASCVTACGSAQREESRGGAGGQAQMGGGGSAGGYGAQGGYAGYGGAGATQGQATQGWQQYGGAAGGPGNPCGATQGQAQGGYGAQPCAGGGSMPNVVTAPPGTAIATEGRDREHPVMRCGPRQSYEYIAGFQCQDGSVPLGNQWQMGARSRRGNVGPNSTGHIIDLYEVPCPEGTQQIYVDMYGCP